MGATSSHGSVNVTEKGEPRMWVYVSSSSKAFSSSITDTLYSPAAGGVYEISYSTQLHNAKKSCGIPCSLTVSV